MVPQRLLEVAIAEFAKRGLEGASTRSIAQAAGTAMSSITYHYGGKQGLYLAAADYITERMGDHMAPLFTVDQIAGITPVAARALIMDIIGRFADAMAAARHVMFSLFIVREQIEPTEAFERIYAGAMGTMFETLVELVRIATDRRDPPTAQITVVTLIGQVVALRASRATVLKVLDRPALDDATLESLKHRIAANTAAILDRLIAERQEPA